MFLGVVHKWQRSKERKRERADYTCVLSLDVFTILLPHSVYPFLHVKLCTWLTADNSLTRSQKTKTSSKSWSLKLVPDPGNPPLFWQHRLMLLTGNDDYIFSNLMGRGEVRASTFFVVALLTEEPSLLDMIKLSQLSSHIVEVIHSFCSFLFWKAGATGPFYTSTFHEESWADERSHVSCSLLADSPLSSFFGFKSVRHGEMRIWSKILVLLHVICATTNWEIELKHKPNAENVHNHLKPRADLKQSILDLKFIADSESFLVPSYLSSIKNSHMHLTSAASEPSSE